MRIHFVGADLEESLGMGILAAVCEQHGHAWRVVSFNDAAETNAAVEQAMKGAPDVIGLSIQFQHRAPEFLALSRALRAAGYQGHITAGGQFPTLAWQETLAERNGVDSVVLHDGEETLVEVLSALDGGAPLSTVRGLALRGPGGVPYRTEPRRLLDDLDGVPFAKRYREHNQHMGVPFIPIIGGRGCWGKCSYCSIIAFYDDAIDAGGGRAVRMRSPENIAAEMALTLDAAGGRAIFCFHDDNFTFPSEKLTLKRVRAITSALESYGVGRAALVGKSRPDTITPTLAKALAEMGVIRLYVGVENAAQEGGEHLQRGTQQEHIRAALQACDEAGIFVCYNLLVFEPEGKLDHVRENIRFIREHATHPVNFCRAEPYFGTSLHKQLASEQDLSGSYLGFNYRIADDRTELAFRICSAAFRERNFAPRGVANRYMGLGYAANVLRRFHNEHGEAEVFWRRAQNLTEKISRDTADWMEKAVELASTVDLADREQIERFTARLGLAIAAVDRAFHVELDELYRDMREHTVAPTTMGAPLRPSPSFIALRKSLAVGLSLSAALGAMACGDSTGPGGSGGRGGSSGEGGMVVDPPPPDGGGGFGVGGAGGNGGAGGQGGEGGMVVDPPPPDGGGGMTGMNDAYGIPDNDRAPAADPGVRRLRLMDQWFDTSPKKAYRTEDLPLADPPRVTLRGRRDGDTVVVELETPALVSTRWEADGDVVGDGRTVRWRPRNGDDRIRVAVRSRGGVAVVSMRAEEAEAVG